jgi:alpha-tubulin suppressor-like RCC1 family protein
LKVYKIYFRGKQQMRNKGISLIILVITIIVIIILAGTTILSLSKNNPIEQANLSVDLNNLATIQEAFEYNRLMSTLNGQYPVTVNVNPLEIDDVTKSYIVDSQEVPETWAIMWDKVYYLDLAKVGLTTNIKLSFKDPSVDISKLFIIDTVNNKLILNKGITVDGEKYYSYASVKNVDIGSEISSTELLKNKITTSLDSQTYVTKENGDVYSVGKIASSNLIGQSVSMYRDVENTLTKTTTMLNTGEQISIGAEYNFLRKADGKLMTIGSNSLGKLGLGDTVDRYSFVQIGLANVKQAFAAGLTSVFLLDNGDVYASGKNFYEYGGNNFYLIKENGANYYSTPTKVEGISNVEKILFVSDFAITVKKTDGTFWGWGSDCFGSFGLGTVQANRTPTEFTLLKALATSRGTTIKDVQTRITTVALFANGEVYTSGFGSYSCLGNGTNTTRNTFTATPILTNIKEISLGATHCYAMTNAGVPYGWGGNGPIGTTASVNGSVIGITTPSIVPIANVVKMVDRYAITTDGSVYKLGLNSYNEFNKKYTTTANIKDVYANFMTSGAYLIDTDNYIWSVGSVSRSMLLGEYGYRFRALKTALTNVKAIYANSYDIIYTTKDDKLYSAGSNPYGSLGLGSNALVAHAQMPNISGIPAISQIAVNSGWADITYILDSNGKIWNTGAVTYGQGVTSVDSKVFAINTKTLPTGTIEKIIGKANQLFVKMTNGKMYGIGYNGNGELGIGNLSDQSSFVEISKDNNNNTIDFSNVKTITDRFSYTYMLMNDGTIYVWGNNDCGQLGLGTISTKENLMKKMTWFTTNGIAIKDIKIGVNFAVFLALNGDVYTIGDNSDGQLGIGNRVSSLVPVKVNIQNVKEIVPSDKYVIAIKEDGSVYSWGKNNYGQCGTRTLDDLLIPTKAIELMQ